MKLIHIFAVQVVTCFFLTISGSAHSEDLYLDQPFQASEFGRSELRLIQLGLSLERDYLGLLDGQWGKNSQRGIDSYAWRQNGRSAQRAHAAELAMIAVSFVVKHDLYHTYSKHLGFSYLWSSNMVEGAHSETFLNYSLKDTSVGVSIKFGDISETSNVHSYVQAFSASDQSLYKVRRNGVLVTSGTDRRGKTLYARSNFVDGLWSTLLVSAEQQDVHILNAITASITKDRFANFNLPENGRLIFAVNAYSDQYIETQPENHAGSDQNSSSGTGFYISADGDVLTNAHVVEGCSTLEVDGRTASLNAVSKNFDLALVKTKGASPQYAEFSQNPAKLNQDITVVGFPLAGLLGGLNVTRGAVSSITGLGGDETTMQISAPVQPGNSGGPVVDQSGAVVGVVVSKLDATRVQEAIGDIPQNINFAIRASAAKLFMSLNGIEPSISRATERIAATDLADLTKAYSVQIMCTQ